MKLALAATLLTLSLPLALAQAPGGAHPPQPTQPIPPAATPPPSSPAPSRPAPIPPPTASAHAAPPTTSPTLPPPPPPMIPLILHDPSDIKTLDNLTREEQDLQKQITDFLNSGNAKLQAWQDQMGAFQKVAQDNWGTDVVYNRQTGKFERPAKDAGKPAEKKP